MSIRESSRHKERKSVIPFGDIMLPVIGLVAVGLLIVGVKLFFLTGEKYTPYTPLPIHQVVKPAPAPVIPAPSAPRKEAQESPVLAVPVNTEKSTGDRVRVESPVASQLAVKPAPSPAQPAAPRPASPPSPAKSRWGVQIGSFTARQSAETVRQQAERAGFNATISTGQVCGKTYFRVAVPAGNARTDAVALSQRLAKAGFPVFVVTMQ